MWQLGGPAACPESGRDSVRIARMNWLSVLQNIGVFAIGSGLLVWLIQSLAKRALDRDLEAFKHGLRKAHEIEMEEAKNRFTVGAASHMANVAFDKHVQFCEAYSGEMFSALTTLFARGPHAEAWCTPQI